jgi:hypothetical protein
MPPMPPPSSADAGNLSNASVPFRSPWPSGGRAGSSVAGDVGSRLESRPEHGLAGGWDAGFKAGRNFPS